MLPIAKDEYRHTRSLIERGLEADLLLLSGGVSAGSTTSWSEYSRIWRRVLFDRVKIQPGQPLVFGRVRDRFFFGLPGNPASTMVCYEISAVPRRTARRRRAPGVTAHIRTPDGAVPPKDRADEILPATLGCNGETVTPVRWSGSGDVAALARSNCFLVTEPDREAWDAVDLIRVLPR